MIQPPAYLKKAKVYVSGLSGEEVKKKYDLKTVLKLCSNENPLPPSSGLVQALQSALPTIHRYPTYQVPTILKASQYYQVDKERVVLGHGSSELIDKLIQAYGVPGHGAVLISENSFPLYALVAQARGLLVYKARMQKNFKVSVQNLLSLLQKHKSIRLIFISNPNNPTGSYITQKEVQLLLSATKGRDVLLIMDEAYQDYARAKDFPNTLKLLHKYGHLVVLRSLSKVWGLAGLRAGVMLAHPSVVQTMQKVLCPFNVHSLSLKAMQYCFSSSSFKNHLSKSKNLVWKSLDYFYKEMTKAKLDFYPSQGNFLLFRSPHPKAFTLLLKKGLILRPLQEPGLKGFLRMSVGLKEENEQAMRWIQQLT